MSRSEKVSYLLSSIHYGDFPGVFNAADVAQLQQALTSHPSSVSYYDLLNVPNDTHVVTTATEKYRSLILRFHPDKTVGKPDQEVRTEIFKLIQAAFETINNPREKQDYDARLRRTSDSTAAANHEREIFKIVRVLQKNKEIRKKTLENPECLLGFAEKQNWIFVRRILLMFRDMLDRDYSDCMRYFPGPGYRNNPFYTPGREKSPTPFLTEFSEKFRDPIIFLLHESIRNPASQIFGATFTVLQANPQWSSVDILLNSANRNILNHVIDALADDIIRPEFQSIFHNARSIELLLTTVNESQRKKICEECVEHIRIVFLFKEHDYFRQMNLSIFPQFIIENFSVVLAHKAVQAYYDEKQASACCYSSFFFSWKSSGSKEIFYALKEISENCTFLFYGGMAHQLYHPGDSLFGGPIDASSHRSQVRKSSKEAYESVFKTLTDCGADVGTNLYTILRKLQLIDEDKKPSQKLFSALRTSENIERMNPLNV